MTISTFIKFSTASIVALMLASCGSNEVQRLETGKEEKVLSDKWNDYDSKLVADEMIGDMLSFPWIKRFQEETGKKRPTVTVFNIQNKSSEHIPVDTFINDIKRVIMRSGDADFVVSGNEKDAMRQEQKEQEVHASAETRKEIGQESGADFAMSGVINSFVDEVDNERISTYQVDLKLFNVQSGVEVWNGTKQVKKYQKKSKFGF